MRSYSDEIITAPTVDTAIPSGAGFGIRLLARLIDIGVSIFLGVVSGFIGGIALAVMQQMGRAPENWVELVQRNTYWGYVFGILGTVLYHWFAEGIGGTTIGKLCCGLNVVQLDGQPCRFGAAGKRSLAYIMDAIFFGLVAYESMKKSVLRQRFGDVWAKTMVVKKDVFTPTPKPAVWKIVVGILTGTALWMAAQITQLFASVFAF